MNDSVFNKTEDKEFEERKNKPMSIISKLIFAIFWWRAIMIGDYYFKENGYYRMAKSRKHWIIIGAILYSLFFAISFIIYKPWKF